MGYSTTTGVIIYCKPYQPFIINRAHHIWFDEYNYFLSIKDKHTPSPLLLWQDPECHIYYSYVLNLIPYKLDLTSTKFSHETIITYDIELPPSRNKIGFNSLDDEDFTFPYITDAIPKYPAGHKLQSQAKINL